MKVKRASKKIDEASTFYKSWWKAFRALCDYFGRGIKTQIHEKIGISLKHISQIYSGDAIASPELMDKISDFFGVTSSEMIKFEEKIIEILNKHEEPFPGFMEVMELPVEERFRKVWCLAAEHCGFGGNIVFLIGDRVYKKEQPLLDTEEAVIEEYYRAKKFWEEKKKILMRG